MVFSADHVNRKMKVKQSRKKAHMSTSDILTTSSMDTLTVDSGTEENGKKSRERRSLGGKVEKKKQGNRKWSLLDIFGLGSAKKNKGQVESKSKKKNSNVGLECVRSDTCPQEDNGIEYTTKQAGHTPKQGQKLTLGSSKCLDLMKMKENVSSKAPEPKCSSLTMRKTGKRTPLMDLVRCGTSGAKVVDSNMLVKDKQTYRDKVNHDESHFNVLSESDVPRIKVNSPDNYRHDNRKKSSSSEVKMSEPVALGRPSRSQMSKVGIAKCLVTEAQSHILNKTPNNNRQKVLSTPISDCDEKQDRIMSCKYSLRSAGSTPPKPPRPRRKSGPRHNLQDINAKLAESSLLHTENADGIVRSTSRKPPIHKPPRRSLPKKEATQGLLGSSDYANLSSVSLEILVKPKKTVAVTPEFLKRKGDSYKASQKSPVKCTDVQDVGASVVLNQAEDVILPPKRRRNSLTESCNSPVMPSNHGRSKYTEQSSEVMTPPSKRRRSTSLSRGRSHSLSRSRSLSSSRLRRNLPVQRGSEYSGSTPRIKKSSLVTRSRSMVTKRPSEVLTTQQGRSPLLTPFTAVMKELEEEKHGKRRKKEKTLADVMKKQLSGVLQHTESESAKKKVTPQKPPRKKLSLKSSKPDIQNVPLINVNTSQKHQISGESESGSSGSEEKSHMKPPMCSGSKPPLRKKPSFISDGVTKVRRRFSKPGDVKKIMESLKANDSSNSLSVNAMNAGHTPKPPRRSRVNSERVIL